MYAYASIDLGDVEKGLDAMMRRSRALGPVFTDLKKPMREDQQDHRKAKTGPEASWAPRAASTSHNGTRKLARRQLGRLPTAVTYKATANSVEGISRVPWSEAQRDGATVGHGARLPARDFLWISDKLLKLATDMIDAALVAAFGGSR